MIALQPVINNAKILKRITETNYQIEFHLTAGSISTGSISQDYMDNLNSKLKDWSRQQGGNGS
jgi:hypothetical protein